MRGSAPKRRTTVVQHPDRLALGQRKVATVGMVAGVVFHSSRWE
ncbi:hypothetical protein Ksed_22600 [Kytococcus sedentarius DSM 20547]|uniref:Uncharacterized protein n=1 Tax=Kytococcus sedentarius (strain ATCC 14392 / DSM 20547 / JCM 11482 / CCUG 33030 / NBRC 15357 / NCTC 11040 / CCM 314 / 541) TaxID=478801 RepID=C7NLZ1_KYTSD|nr:hypothetical protein Ksed_22600 [Kytococcus sedentarius DSM 20547]